MDQTQNACHSSALAKSSIGQIRLCGLAQSLEAIPQIVPINSNHFLQEQGVFFMFHNSLTDPKVIVDLLIELTHQIWFVLPCHLDVVVGDLLENLPKEALHLLICLNLGTETILLQCLLRAFQFPNKGISLPLQLI